MTLHALTSSVAKKEERNIYSYAVNTILTGYCRAGRQQPAWPGRLLNLPQLVRWSLVAPANQIFTNIGEKRKIFVHTRTYQATC